MCLRRRMVEKYSRLAGQLSYIERVLHQQEDIHVSRLSLSGDERSENHKPSQLARAERDVIDSFKPLRHREPLPRSLAEVAKYLLQSGTVNSRWKIAIFFESRERSFRRLRHRPLLPQVPGDG